MMQKWIVFLAAVCLWISPSLSQAAQTEEDFTLSSSSEVFFPQAIRFNVTLARPLTDISLATLIIQQQGQAPITISIDLEDAAVVSDPYTELAYSWMIPRANPPRLFEEITFSWRVVSTRDEVSESESSLTFTDQRTAWVQESDPAGKLILTIPALEPSLESVPITPADMQVETTPEPVNAPNEPAVGDMTIIPPAAGVEAVIPEIAFTPSGPQPTIDLPVSGASRLMTDLQPVYESLSENTGRDLALNLLVYTDAFPPGCTQNGENQPVARGPVSGIEIPCDESLVDVIFRASGYDLLQSESSSLNQIEIVVTAAMVARFYEIAWQGKVVPDWFQVGLKQFYAPNLKSSLYPILMRTARTNGLLPLDGSGSVNANVELWQAQSYGLVLYIADQIGVPGLFRLANADADTFAAAYQAAMGKPLSTLLNDWERWIFTDRAVTAFSFTANQAATATPTATRTLSPSPTATATSTFTPTFTPTVTGVLSATPSPTRTPTRTLTPEPATSTPRPAGSLNTPTPVPPPAVNPISSLSSPATALGILTIGLVLIAVFALFLLRPRQK
jgi:hypothetical protein